MFVSTWWLPAALTQLSGGRACILKAGGRVQQDDPSLPGQTEALTLQSSGEAHCREWSPAGDCSRPQDPWRWSHVHTSSCCPGHLSTSLTRSNSALRISAWGWFADWGVLCALLCALRPFVLINVFSCHVDRWLKPVVKHTSCLKRALLCTDAFL